MGSDKVRNSNIKWEIGAAARRKSEKFKHKVRTEII